MIWTLSHRAAPSARALADRHYNRQHIGAPQFVPPGRCLVLYAETPTGRAFWITSWPFAQYVRHAWAGAWVCSAFRNEGAGLASDLIRQATAAIRWTWPDVPVLGMVSFVDADRVRHKRDPGRCYLRAGWHPAVCPKHGGSAASERAALRAPGCAACLSRTEAGLLALQVFADEMPPPESPIGGQAGLPLSV